MSLNLGPLVREREVTSAPQKRRYGRPPVRKRLLSKMWAMGPAWEAGGVCRTVDTKGPRRSSSSDVTVLHSARHVGGGPGRGFVTSVPCGTAALFPSQDSRVCWPEPHLLWACCTRSQAGKGWPDLSLLPPGPPPAPGPHPPAPRTAAGGAFTLVCNVA